MAVPPTLGDARVVRLNAKLFPVSEPERALYDRYGLSPFVVEAARPESIIPHVRSADAVCVVSASLPRQVIDSLDNCRLISRLGNGTDKIDVARATERGILVSNVPDFCTDEMADHVMAMLLSFARAIPSMTRHMQAGAYQQARAEALQLRRLSGRVLGLIGFGASARAVARRALPFGLEVIATRRDLGKPRADADQLGVELVELGELLERSDYVSLHLPLNSETRHLLDRQALLRMKRGACLINAARGEIVDEDALADLLDQGHLAGAGLDTFGVIDVFGEVESAPDHPLFRGSRVITTPHVSALSVDSTRVVATGSVQNLVSVLRGRLPHPDHIVNRDVVPRYPLQPHDPSPFAED